jgi:hypothetical protein
MSNVKPLYGRDKSKFIKNNKNGNGDDSIMGSKSMNSRNYKSLDRGLASNEDSFDRLDLFNKNLMGQGR